MLLLLWLCATFTATAAAAPDEVADTLERILPGVVGVGTASPARTPAAQLRGTGFAVGDGRYVVTCAHVLDDPLDASGLERFAVFTGRGDTTRARAATVVATDREHDLAILRIDGTPLPALKLGASDAVREGWQLYLTGFPLGPVLGLYPVTQRAGIASIAPRFTPMIRTRQLDAATIRAARDPFLTYTLDAVAYPGHSGSPLWQPATGKVYGVVNSVLVKGSREAALAAPSGIGYAIPVRYVEALLQQARTAP